jgi:CheY-like chemotaxis protein
MLEVAAREGRVEEEGWRVRKDGSTFWASVLLTAIRDEAGSLRGFVEISRDHTARNAMEARLAHLASFPQDNPNPIVEADDRGRVKYANPAALRLFPDLRDEASDHPWLAGWDGATRSLRDGSAATHVRVVTVGERSYHQTLVRSPGESVIRAYGIDITTLDRSKGGLGLGLALVKGLVDMHGGSVTVASDGLGKGAEFVVRLPLESAEPHAPEPPPSGAEARPRRVLVIEDNVDAAESLKDVLEFHEHTVEVAFNGPQGLDKARAFGPDVVLCDIGLPGMDGYDVARAMRADPALRGARLVALTGYAAPEDVARSKEAGFDVHLAKPPTLEKLAEALAQRAPAGPDGASA